MTIEIYVPTMLRRYTGGRKVVEGIGDTLQELVNDLDSRHPGLRGKLITPEGTLHRFVQIHVNDGDVRSLDGVDTKLSDGDAVTMQPALAGGLLGFAAAAALHGEPKLSRRI